MVRNGEIALADVKRSLRRHWWIPLMTMLLLGLAGIVAVLVLPKKYTSTTMVLVEQPTVPGRIREAGCKRRPESPSGINERAGA